MSERHDWISHSIDGRTVHVVLRDGTRIDDCQVVARGRTAVESWWLFADGEDLFVPIEDVVDIVPADGRVHRAA